MKTLVLLRFKKTRNLVVLIVLLIGLAISLGGIYWSKLVRPPATFPGRLIHDFGTIHGGEEYTHGFEVRNITAAPIKVLRANTTCKCTLVQISGEVIPPHGHIIATIGYSAPNSNINDSRVVSLDLEGGKKIELQIDAAVRRSISIERNTLEMRENSSARLVVRNYGAKPWDRIEFTNVPKVLDISAVRIAKKSGEKGPEKWGVDLKVAGYDGPRSVFPIEMLPMRDDGSFVGNESILVTIHPELEVTISPPRIMFESNVNRSQEANVSLLMRGEFNPSSVAGIKVRYPDDCGLTHRINQVFDGLVNLQIELRANTDISSLEKITIEFSGRQYSVAVGSR